MKKLEWAFDCADASVCIIIIDRKTNFRRVKKVVERSIVRGGKKMKKIIKKITSLTLAASMLVMAWGGIAAGAADSSYKDYVPGEKPANMIPDASTDYGVKYLNTKHSKIDTEFYKTDTELEGYRAKFSYNGAGALELSTAWRGYEGFSLNNGNASFGFVPEDGATYVLSMNLKNMSENGVIPSVGAAMNNTYGPANLIYTKEYGESGMQLTDSWQKFNASITLPADYTSKIANDDFAKHIHIGMPAGTAEGAAFAVDVSTEDAVYFAKEAAYDISVKADNGTGAILSGGSASYTANIVNQVGTVGALNQACDWVVLDSQKNPVTEGFTISENGNKAVVSAADDVECGTYYVYASSKAYEMGKSAALQVVSYKDYVPGEKPANMIPDASTDYGVKYLNTKHSKIDTEFYKTDTELEGYRAKFSYNGAGALELSTAWRGYEGFSLNNGNASFGFVPEDGATYVLSMNLKNMSENGVIPSVGAAMNNTYGPANLIYTKEYGESGMQLTDSWQKFNASITLPADYTSKIANDDFAKHIHIGMPAGTAEGAAFAVDVSTEDAVYFAKEAAYDINTEIIGEKNVGTGSTVRAKASVVNQVGTAGALPQNFEWIVLDESRLPVEGFTVNSEGSTASIVPGKQVKPGTYLAYAKSTDYNMGKAVAFDVISYSNYVPGEKPANMIPDASDMWGTKYFDLKYSDSGDATNNITGEYYKKDTDIDGYYAGYYFKNSTGSLLLNGNAWKGFAGISLNGGNGAFGFIPEDGKTYVLSMNLKNMSENGVTPSVGAAMNNTYGPGTLVYTNEYGESGMQLTDKWQKFNASITIPEDYHANAVSDIGDIMNRIHIGFPEGTDKRAKFAVDVSTKDAVYFAKEAAYDITLSSEQESENKIVLTASVINQIGLKGGLSQEFDWVVLDGNSNEVDGVTVTPISGTSRVSAEWSEGEDISDYRIAAVSKEYAGFTRLASLGGEKPVKLYVAASGNDSNDGSAASPLATLAGAKAKIKALRNSSVTNPIEVEFAAGKYYFDQTVAFTAEDSQTARVTFKAADGASVVFTGAVSLDLANAVPVTDSAVLNRLKDEVKNNVVEMELPSDVTLGSAIGATIQKLQGEYEYPQIYLNGSKQEIAQWPNGDGKYAKFNYVSANNGVLPSVIGFNDEEPKSWQKADNMWLGGYFSYDYLYQRMPVNGISSSGFSLTTADGVIVGNEREISQRYKAFNVLEELDTPKEWYIDWTGRKVYYYAPETDGDSLLEISSLKDAMISITNADNIAFSGITFENTRGDAIKTENVENIKITGCTFKNIGTDAISAKGSVWAESDKDYWQRQYIDAAYNFEVADNVFYNIGGHAIVMDGGNVDTLKPSGNVIKNNIFNRCSQTIKNYESILIKGCGTSFIHNNVSCAAFQAIRHYGNNHTISYNEIYNVNQETDDCGAIYCGRNTIQRGTVISYNYLHDLKSVETLPFGHQVGIYWDDNQTGMKAEYNIIKNVNVNFYTNGVDNYFCNNTSIDIAKTNLDVRNGGAASNQNPEQAAFAGNIADEELYFKTYPNLQTIVGKTNRKDPALGELNYIENNLRLGSLNNGIESNMTHVSNNAATTDTTIFVNPEKQDYRVKNASEYSAYVLNEDFDIDLIGVTSANKLAMNKVELNYPANNMKMNSDSVHFEWNYVPGATSYTITVASDAGFSNVVASVDSYYNYADIALGSSTYYWKVSAKNTSREFASTVESEAYSFVNGEKISVDAKIENGKLAAEITNIFYEEGKNADVYIAQYGEKGNLLKVVKAEVGLDYLDTYQLTDSDADLTVSADTKTVGIFIWEGLAPLDGAVKIPNNQ